MMRIVIAATAAAVLFLNATPSHALYGDAPWCAVVEIGRGSVHWDCQYQSIEQCRPNVIAGNRGFCNLNPYYAAPTASPRVRHRARHHAHHPA